MTSENIKHQLIKPEGSLGRTAQDGHLDSHTAPEGAPGEPRTATSTLIQLLSTGSVKFSVDLRPLRQYGLLGAGSPGRPPSLSHSS